MVGRMCAFLPPIGDREDQDEEHPLWLPQLDNDDGLTPEVGPEDLSLSFDCEDEAGDDRSSVDADVLPTMVLFDEESNEPEDPERPLGIDGLDCDPSLDGGDGAADDSLPEMGDDADLDPGGRDRFDDGGEEGTGENLEDELDEIGLPLIDDDADPEEPPLDETLFAQGPTDERILPAPMAPQWEPLEGAGARVPCWSVAAVGGRVAAAGEVLMFVEDGGRTARPLAFAHHAMTVSFAFDALVVSSSRGELCIGSVGTCEPRGSPSFQPKPLASVPSESLGDRDEEGRAKSCSMERRGWPLAVLGARRRRPLLPSVARPASCCLSACRRADHRTHSAGALRAHHALERTGRRVESRRANRAVPQRR